MGRKLTVTYRFKCWKNKHHLKQEVQMFPRRVISKEFIVSAVLLLAVFLVLSNLKTRADTLHSPLTPSTLPFQSPGLKQGFPVRSEVILKTQNLRMPFIANDGQTDKRIKIYFHPLYRPYKSILILDVPD